MKTLKTKLLSLSALSLLASSAWAVTPPGTPPTFSCHASNPDKVAELLNTRGVSATDQLNQPRWEYTGRFPEATRPTAAATVPTTTWTYFDGHEMDRYYTPPFVAAATPARPYPLYPDRFVGHFGNPPEPGNQMRHFRYKFRLASDVDPATYQLSITQAAVEGWNSTVRQDDVLVGVYVNGELAVAPLHPQNSLTGTTLLGGAGGAGGKLWRAGENELVFAVWDSGGGAIWLGLQAADQAVCNILPKQDVTAVPTLGTWSLGLMSAMLGGLGLWRRRRA